MRRFPPHCMDAIRRLTRLLAAAACLVVVSCIDGREEYWLESDGSGRAEVRYEVPAGFVASIGGIGGVEDVLDRFVKETPTLSGVTRSVTRHGDRLTVEFKGNFKSVQDLIAAVSGDSALRPAGETSPLEPLIGDFVVRQQGARVEFQRTIYPGRALPGSALLPASQLKGRSLVYLLHLPVVPDESNATRTADHGRTLIWEHSLESGVLRKFSLHFQAELPLPWGWIAAGVAAIGLVVAVILHAIIRRRRAARPLVT